MMYLVGFILLAVLLAINEFVFRNRAGVFYSQSLIGGIFIVLLMAWGTFQTSNELEGQLFKSVPSYIVSYWKMTLYLVISSVTCILIAAWRWWSLLHMLKKQSATDT